MFGVLPGSHASLRSPASGLVAAVISHAAIVAVVLCSHTVRGDQPHRLIVVDSLAWSSPSPASAPQVPEPPAEPALLPSLPVVDPSILPPLEPGASPGTPVGSFPVTTASGRLPGVGGVWAPDVVDERPEVLSGPPLVYPEQMRQTGIEGGVVVEVVIDTLGRAEPGSLRTVDSSQRAFEAAATAYVRRALFRPARVMGRPVRVLIRLPIEFRIAR